MSHNSFGHLFRFTSWGESHGPALGCVIDGCPAGITLTEATSSLGWISESPARLAMSPSGAKPMK